MLITILIIILIIYIISKRNGFEKLRRSVTQEGSNIGIQNEKRIKLLKDAMGIVKVSYSHEIDGIEQLTINDQLDKLLYLGQKYPDLKSIGPYDDIVRKTFEINEDICAKKELLNGNIRMYNDAITEFPGMIVAKLFGYKPEKFLDEENFEENKKVIKEEIDFSKF